jgi:dTDP-4-amino-4,6-dideoxygalactose transaminase
MKEQMSRRGFAGAAVALPAAAAAANGKPAMLGGAPVRKERFPGWPVVRENDERALLEVLRAGKWNRAQGGMARKFEETWARLLGAKHSLATANGTSALIAALGAMGIGPGDEVIVPPYTFVATINAVMLHHALPVFADTDIETFQMDARSIPAALSERTALILPVHMAGSAANLDAIFEIAKARRLPVLEDACQAHFGEWRGRKLGTLGAAGCFSFQASKNLNSGEGGAIASDDGDLMARCDSFHNNGRGADPNGFGYVRNGANLRITEFQAALLLSQLTRTAEQSARRDRNAAYLTKRFREIPGITPARLEDGCTRSAWHLYMFRYSKQEFEGLSRATFVKALAAEGIPCSRGYVPLNKEPLIEAALSSKGFRAIYGEKRLKEWRERNLCPANDRLCEEAVWFTQTMLLGTQDDMDQIADAVLKIRASAGELRKIG